MHIISVKKLREFWTEHPAAELPLRAWVQVVRHASWTCFADVRADYASCDQVGRCIVFNIGGNKFRLVVRVKYVRHALTDGTVFVRHVLTHPQYDRNGWKGDC